MHDALATSNDHQLATSNVPALVTVGLAVLLVLMGLVPLWIGGYPPLYDYPQHLLEARIVADYHDPQTGYAEGYSYNQNWQWRSNALTTMMMAVLGMIMPIELAGRLVVSSYVLLLVGGLWRLLRISGAPLILLLLAGPLVYNVNFTSGFLNFSYAFALSIWALIVVVRWKASGHARYLWLLAALMLLVYLAHMFAWALTAVIIAALSGATRRPQRAGWLWLAVNSALPLIILAWPAFALPAALILPLVWAGTALLRALHLRRWQLTVGLAGLLALLVLLIKGTRPLYETYLPGTLYETYEKLFSPLRLFSLRFQTLPADSWLLWANLLLLALLAALATLLVWSTLRNWDARSDAWAAALALLLILYVAVPSQIAVLWITEQRVLLFATTLGILCVRLPGIGSVSRRAVTGLLLAIAVWSAVVTSLYALDHQARVADLRAQLYQLEPARDVLVLRPQRPVEPPGLAGMISRRNPGEHLAVLYNLEQGGLNSWTFANGPVAPRSELPVPAYFHPDFNATEYVVEYCPALRASYDAALVWGAPEPELRSVLEHCFGPGQVTQDMGIWHSPAP